MGYLLGICGGEKGDLKDVLEREESRFKTTLEKGEKHLQAKLDDALENARVYSADARLSGKDDFHLYNTYGYPIEMTTEGAHELGVSVGCLHHINQLIII
nr:alanine--tRNA ligase, chloroplastic/mitochondrial [Tanacetum cinerariifolium]